ncbi:MAG: amidohydrolase family protein [Rubrivivax sp.]|nr:amidohydrolase family protein [Rubrivivax sp.]
MKKHESLRSRSGAAPVGLLAAVLLCASPGIVYGSDCPGGGSIRLVNGKIHTMDAQNRVVSSVLIDNGEFAAVGNQQGGGSPGCTRVINLHGRTVVPGLIDNHNHIILLGLRPGNDVRLDKARSIAKAQELLAAKAATVPAGEWVVSLGGLHRNQFVAPPATARFPNLAELDAALPAHPTLLYESFSGPSQTNSIGKTFFESQGIVVGADGTIAANTQSLLALQALRILPQHNNPQAKMRGLLNALGFGVSVGLTTHVDQGSFHFAQSFFGNPGTSADGLAAFDQYRAFDAARALHAMGRLPARVQINYLHIEPDVTTPQLTQRLNNAVPLLGDQWLSNGGIGEFTAGAPFGGIGSAAWMNGTRQVAQHGWRNENHSLSRTDFVSILDFWNTVNTELKTIGIPQTPAAPDPLKPNVVNPAGITQLRWVVAHVPFITPSYIELSKNLGVGLSVLGGWRWLSGTPTGNGPPFRTILDLGARAGMSSDGMQIAVMDPWTGMYYAVTGKNARGELINAGQTITREQVLRLYTADNAWFLGPKWEKKLGTIEKGKWADLVVLSADYFDPHQVSDEQILDIRSVMTIVNGKVVHDELGR